MQKLESNINLTKDELFDYLNSSTEFQDLTKQFNDLYNSSPETHELFMLIYQEFQTTEKLNKRKISKLFNLNAKSKDRLLIILQDILDDITQLKKDVDKAIFKETWDVKIKKGFTFKNILRAVGTTFVVLIFFVILEAISPEVFKEAMEFLHMFEKEK